MSDQLTLQSQNTPTHLQIPTPNQNDLHNFKEKINIATHNIRGINNLTKFHLWIDFCLQEKLHIVSLTETKLKDNPNATTNPHYKIFTSNYHPTSTQSRETSLGTAILVHNTIQPYIHDINTLPGTAIYIDFFFPGNKTRVISIYLPSNNNELSTRTQKQVSLWTVEAKRRNWHILLLGDFNANPDTHKKNKLPLFSDLFSNNLTSLLNFHKILEPTWQGRGLNSQIDDIWTSSRILLDFDPPQLTDPTGISDSDHKILTTTWYTNFTPTVPRNKKKKRKTFCYKKATTEDWENFRNKTSTLLRNANFIPNITNPDQLNKSW